MFFFTLFLKHFVGFVSVIVAANFFPIPLTSPHLFHVVISLCIHAALFYVLVARLSSLLLFCVSSDVVLFSPLFIRPLRFLPAFDSFIKVLVLYWPAYEYSHRASFHTHCDTKF